MNYLVKYWKNWGFHFLLFGIFSLTGSYVTAGLVLRFDPSIRAQNIKNIKRTDNSLIVTYREGKKEIKIPSYLINDVLLWAIEDTSNLIVISVDAVFAGGAPTYVSPSVPYSLHGALVGYDVSAHSIAVNGGSTDTSPLVSRFGKSAMPYERRMDLLDPSNNSFEAKWYRRLTVKYINPPGAVGSLTIIARASKKGFPVYLQVESQLNLNTSVWYRDSEVPSLWDWWAMSLPYQPLKHDMESRWESYRKAYPRMEEISSIVEAYAIIGALKRDKPHLLKNIDHRESNFFSPFSFSNRYSRSDSQNLLILDKQIDKPQAILRMSWRSWSKRSIGQEVETSAEAHLALCLMKAGDVGSEEEEVWIQGIEKISHKNSYLKAKWLLYQALTSTDKDLFDKYSSQFLDLVKSDMRYYRLRVDGYRLLRSSGWISDQFKAKWKKEGNDLISDFVTQVREIQNQPSPYLTDIWFWDNLSQHVFSTNLEQIFHKTSPEDYPDRFEFIEMIAYLHYKTGSADLVGDEVNYRHAHYRFLGYLSKNFYRHDNNLNTRINSYRDILWYQLNSKHWSETTRDWAPDLIQQAQNQARIRKAIANDTILTGTLLSGKELFTKKPFKWQDILMNLEAGIPAGIKTDEQFLLLQLDPRLLAKLYQYHKNGLELIQLKVQGTLCDDGKSLLPYRIAYLTNHTWKILDLPFSGTTAIESIAGDP